MRNYDNKVLESSLKELNKQIKYIIENNELSYNRSAFPEARLTCSQNPINGGSGICHCILNQIEIT